MKVSLGCRSAVDLKILLWSSDTENDSDRKQQNKDHDSLVVL